MTQNKAESIGYHLKKIKAYAEPLSKAYLTAFILWLFGVLVFIPMANAIDKKVGLLCSLIVFVVFTVQVAKSFTPYRKVVNAISFLLMRKFARENEAKLDYYNFYRNLIHIVYLIVLYCLYFPLLFNIHPGISGLALIIVIAWIFILLVNSSKVITSKILDWLAEPTQHDKSRENT